jgi:hypothetical protein
MVGWEREEKGGRVEGKDGFRFSSGEEKRMKNIIWEERGGEVGVCMSAL